MAQDINKVVSVVNKLDYLTKTGKRILEAAPMAVGDAIQPVKLASKLEILPSIVREELTSLKRLGFITETDQPNKDEFGDAMKISLSEEGVIAQKLMSL